MQPNQRPRDTTIQIPQRQAPVYSDPIAAPQSDSPSYDQYAEPSSSVPAPILPVDPPMSHTPRVILPLSPSGLQPDAPVSSPSPQYADSPVNSTYDPGDNVGVSANPDSYPADDTSRLITEPINRSAQSYPQSQPIAHPPVTASKKTHKIRNSIIIVFLALIAGAFYAVPILAGNVSASDLVEAETDNTTYLRPKQWKQLGETSSSKYGNMLGANGKSTAMILVSRSPTQSLSLANMSDSMVDKVRQSVLTTLTDESIASAFTNGDSGCKEVTNIQKKSDTRSAGSTTGIYTLTAECRRDDGMFVINMRGLFGKDGYVRTVGVVAAKNNWDRNQDVYQKMIDSVQQKDDSA